MSLSRSRSERYFGKIADLNWGVITLITLISIVGFFMLTSAAGGEFTRWARPQLIRFMVGFAVMIAIAMVDIRVWISSGYIFYLAALMLLIAVEVIGFIGMGAKRWINFYFFNFQPSDLMKISLVLGLTKYFHQENENSLRNPLFLLPAIAMIVVPALLVLRQPDLGTAIILLMVGGIMLFAAGVHIYYFVGAGLAAGLAIPVVWKFLHAYQKRRIFTFLDPESDPLGAGYHIMQSKIALGSGGFTGKGYMQGTQSYLNFLPEKQTDFIFTMFSEEFGFLGSFILIALYGLLVFYGYKIVLRSRNHFGRLMGLGIVSTIFFYIFINIAMVTGLLPVVGIPLPLVSYGGTSMITLLMSFGFLLSADLHRDFHNKTYL